MTHFEPLFNSLGPAERELICIGGERLVTLFLEPGDVADALAAFDPIWESLSPREQTRGVQLLVERVDYDGHRGKVAVTFHPGGIRKFADEFGTEEDAA